MVLNYIWIGFFLVGFVVGLIRLIFFQDLEVFPNMFNSTLDMAKSGFEIALYLTGVLSLWMGLMKVGEKAGMIRVFSRLIGPLFSRLFPQIPKDHPAVGTIVMNIAANMLGLDNAATPIGLKAMQQLQELNDKKDTASNPMIMMLVLNTSGLTIIPVAIMVYRAQQGAANPADIFLPILIATYFSTLAGLVATSIYQRINLFNKVVLAYLLGITAFIAGLIYYFLSLPKEDITVVSNLMSSIILMCVIVSFIGLALIKKINVYETFIEGAKEGFQVAITIIPYLIAILVAIGVFRASGTLDYMISGVAAFVSLLGFNTEFIPALPTALMRPLSGSGARGMMIDVMKTYGADSFPARVACTIQGSTDTTFYIIALYFGSVGVKNTRHAIPCGLIADLFGVVAAIFMAYLFFY